MADLRAASRYVKSLLGLAVEKNALDAVHADMEMFSRICQENRPFVMMLKSPVIRHEKKRAVLEKLFSTRVNPLTMAIVDILTRKNREGLLPAIASEFHNAYNEFKGVGKATLTTTLPIDKTLRDSIEAIVKKLSDKKFVELEEKLDKDLIGGFILNVGDRQIDASVKGKLRAIEMKFMEDHYEKKI